MLLLKHRVKRYGRIRINDARHETSKKHGYMENSRIDEIIKAFESKITSRFDESTLVESELVSEIADEEEIEMKFSLQDGHSKKLFIALARKYGYKPYRYPRQKRTTVILKGKRAFFEDVLWPHYVSLSQDLTFLLEQVTNEAVRAILRGDPSDLPNTRSDG